MELPQTPIFLDTNEISEWVKIPKREIGRYVRVYGMPAFQERANGRWKARPEPLRDWAKDHQRRFVK